MCVRVSVRSERVFLRVFVFARVRACVLFDVFVVLEQVFLHIDVGMRTQALAVIFTKVRSL